MRKCKACKGKGWVFITVPTFKDGPFGFPLIGETGDKATCGSCFGKGVK